MMDYALAERVIRSTSEVQARYDAAQHPKKLVAKAHAVELLGAKLTPGDRVLDVGGEPFYQGPLEERFTLTSLNLPDDMHAMAFAGEFEGALAMHVLEHSPFPLYVLALLHRALVPGGWLYVAVPKPCTKFCKGYGHRSVLPDPMWRTLLREAGFRLDHAEAGSFGRRRRWIEYRYLAERV
jgi:SAM-dependent methyltransferase